MRREDSGERGKLPIVLTSAQLAGWAACVGVYHAARLHVAWTTVPIAFPLIGVAAATWLVTRRRTRTDAALAVALLLSVSTLMLFLQYAALAAGRPLIDSTLRDADAALGISMSTLVTWTLSHPAIAAWLESIYASLGLQLAAAVAIVAVRQDRDALWEFVAHYHVCLGLTIAACALWPATEPWVYLRLPDLADQTRAVAEIAAFHAGAQRVVDVGAPAGLVAMPSFHVAAAWLATWTVRRCRPAFAAFSAISLLLTASTVLLGVHYAIDSIAGTALVAASISAYGWSWRGWTVRNGSPALGERSAPLVRVLPSERALTAD